MVYIMKCRNFQLKFGFPTFLFYICNILNVCNMHNNNFYGTYNAVINDYNPQTIQLCTYCDKHVKNCNCTVGDVPKTK